MRAEEDRGVVPLADLAAVTGTGWLGIKALHTLRTAGAPSGVEATPVNDFGDWADELWQQSCPYYPFIGDRRRDTLNALYPQGERFLRYIISRGSEILGWAVVLDTQMHDNQYFGNLRVGTLADCLAPPENASAVVRAATAVLEKRGVDLIISNHSHAVWGNSFRSAGYLLGPSNFIFAASKPLAERLGVSVLIAPEVSDDGFGADPDSAVKLVRSLAAEGGTSVLCSQGEAIPGLLAGLSAELSRPVQCRKGSVWAVSMVSDRVVAADYYPRPAG